VPAATAVLLAAIGVALGLGACRNGPPVESTIVRVGHAHIIGATLAHWMSVLAPRHVVPDPRDRVLERQTLDFLISSAWLAGEAAQEGSPVSEREVRQRLRAREREFPDGRNGFEESLEATAHTVGDVELEIENELASSKIRQRLRANERAVTKADIVDYYRVNFDRFEHPERRYFYIVENLGSYSTAREIAREIAGAKRSIAKPGGSLYESLARPRKLGKAATIVKVIFAAKPGAVSAPIKVERFYFLIEVAKVVPAGVQALAQVRVVIAGRIARARQRRTLARFTRAWRHRWAARTDCRPRYVVDDCRQYRGRPVHTGPLSLS
jgi:foldase protein PrsA